MPTSDQPYDDEIDLVELMTTVWQGRWLIIGCTAAVLIIAALWLVLQTPSYETKASVTAPDQGDYSMVFPGHLASEKPSPKQMLAKVMGYMTSPNNQARFFETQLGISREDDLPRIQSRINALKITPTDGQSELQPQRLNLVYTADTPEKARKIITAFISEAKQTVIEQITSSAHDIVQRNVSELSQTIKTEQAAYKERLDKQIVQLQQARKQAREHNVQRNQHQSSANLLVTNSTSINKYNNGSTQGENGLVNQLQRPLYEYGDSALAAMIANRKDAQNYEPDSIIKLKAQRDGWQQLTIASDKAEVLTLNESPTPGRRTPSMKLVMAIAGMLGIFLGVAVVLVRQAWRTHR